MHAVGRSSVRECLNPVGAGVGDRQIVQAVVIASASNNMLKLVYTYVFGSRRTANLVAPAMVGLAVLSVL